VAALVATAALAFSGLLFAQPAAAAEVEGVFTDVHIVEEEQFHNGSVQVAYTMEIPDSATEGDTTVLTFPALLDYPSGSTVEVKDPEGVLVATGVATGAKEITFTFTDYVDDNLDVTITGLYGLIVNDPAANYTSKEFVFESSGETFVDNMITKPSAAPPLTSVYIKGYWTDEEDRGKTETEDAVIWRGSLSEGPWDEQTVTMVPVDDTTLFNCDSVTFWEGYAPDGAVYHGSVHESTWLEHDPADIGASVVSCSPTELVAHFAQPAFNREVYQVRVLADVVDPDTTAYFEAQIANGETTWLNFVARDLGLGEGIGIVRDPELELIKYSKTEGVDEGDFDEAPGKSLAWDTDEVIVFRIVNTGNDTVSGISLTDETTAGDEAVLSCDLDGIAILPGEWFECEAVLSASAAGSYSDTATVVGTGLRSGDRAEASDAWFGTLAEKPAEPTPTPSPEDPTPTTPPGDDHGNSNDPGDGLAVTGADLDYSVFWLAGIAIAGGVVVVVLASNRSRARARRMENL
jgi:hypothetical protein